MTALLKLRDVMIATAGGRQLFDGLNLRLEREHVALVGRNGVGKSTLLAVLAGSLDVRHGSVRTSSEPHLVPQALPRDASTTQSHGEQRRQMLTEAHASGAELLLLDEPSEDLDDAGVTWLRGWLKTWPGGVLVASHDRRLLADFRHFFIVSESGCRYFAGTLEELDAEVEREHRTAEERYVKNLRRFAARAEQSELIARRKARKKRRGRCAELDRGTPRIRLNQKRSDAEVSHGRLAKLGEARLDALRRWSLSTRRALGVRLALELAVPSLPEVTGDALVLRGVPAGSGRYASGQTLSLELARQRVALVGPNGAGKTTLLEVMLGQRAPGGGSVLRDGQKLGSIRQGAADWMLDDSLLARLSQQEPTATEQQLAERLVAHKFPLALAERPLRTLSPGERTRAALICLFSRVPAVEVLLLDEPTYSLDLVGQRALVAALCAWPGGLVVASHDRSFIDAIGVDEVIDLG
jgi:ATPase subunit of ABC transporter with duplicated ATPase domains